MPKADVLQLVADLSDGLADQTASSAFYDDIINQMGLAPAESLVNAAYISVVANQATYAYPLNAIRILALLFDTVYLTPSNIREAEAYDKNWRSQRGEPRTWLVEQESRRGVTVVPVPPKNGANLVQQTPFDNGHPEGNLMAIFSEDRLDVHPFEELMMALMVLVREFTRDSDHTDHQFAELCKQVSTFFQMLIGEA